VDFKTRVEIKYDNGEIDYEYVAESLHKVMKDFHTMINLGSKWVQFNKRTVQINKINSIDFIDLER